MRKITFLVALYALLSPMHTLLAQTTFVVTNTNAGGTGSLSNAITSANSTPGQDIITFNIAATPCVIPVSTMLTITEAVWLNGYSQPGSAAATTSSTAVNPVVLQGNGTIDGLYISSATDVVVEGLTFNNFNDALIIDNSSGVQIIGCYIGLDYTGMLTDDLFLATRVYRNDYGIHLINGSRDCKIGNNGSDAQRNVINGNNYFGLTVSAAGLNNQILNNYIGINAAGDLNTNSYNAVGINISGSDRVTVGEDITAYPNVISGNYNAGVMINGSNYCTVIGNYIGTDPTGTQSRPNVQGNQAGAVYIVGGYHNTIGGVGTKRNVISGNNAASSTAYGAVYINGNNTGSDTHTNVVIGNYIGVAADGTTALPNIRGVYIDATAFNNTIGNGAIAAQNIIAYNANEAIVINGSGTNTNKINVNAVYCNGSGVTISNGGNNNHMKPTIYAANDQRVIGYAMAGDSVQLYLRDAGCAGPQGKTYLGMVWANTVGMWEFSSSLLPIGAGDYVVAIGYDSQNRSSAFSDEAQVVVCNAFTVYAGNDMNACTGGAITMAASPPGGSQSGKWMLANGTATIDDFTDPNTTVRGLNTPGPVSLIWDVMDNATYCGYNDDVLIIVNPCELKVYNLISPNGDNVYDYLKIDGIGSSDNVELTIANRWGDVVFRTDHYNNTSNNFTGHSNEGSDKGKMLPDGTYFYKVVNLSNGAELSGYLELKK